MPSAGRPRRAGEESNPLALTAPRQALPYPTRMNEDRLWKIVQSVAGALQVLNCRRVVVGKVRLSVDGEGGFVTYYRVLPLALGNLLRG